MPLELVILIGLQGSGKSSFYRTHFAQTHVWVSKDRMRQNRVRKQQRLLEEALTAGRSVVVDNTNPTVADRAALIEQGRRFGAKMLGYFLESRLADCLERNRQRTGKERVPDVALFATRKNMVLPSLTEGFDQLYFVRLLDPGQFEIRDWQEGGDHATG